MGFAEGFEKGWTMVETMRANKHKREMDEADLALKKQQEEREARAANQQYEFNQQNNPLVLGFNKAASDLKAEEANDKIRGRINDSLEGPAKAAADAQERESKRLKLFTDQYDLLKKQHEDAVAQLAKAQYRIDMAAAGGTDPDPGDIATRDSWQGQVSKYQGQLAAMGDPTKAAAGFRIADAMANPEIQAALLSDRDVNKFIQSNTPAGQVFAPTSVYAVGSNLVVRGNTIDGKTGEVIAQDGYLSNASGTPVTVPVDVIEPLINRYRQDTEDASTPAQLPGPDGKPVAVKGVTKSTMSSAMQYAPTVLQEAERAYNKPEFANLKKLMSLEQFQRLALAVPFVESSWNPKSVSPKDAVGLYQLMPDTARQPGRNVTPVADLSTLADPQVNIRIGVEYLGGTINHFNSVEKGIYYYGPQKNDPLYPQKIAETLRSGAPDALMGKGAGRSLGDGYEAVTSALKGGQQPATPAAGQPAAPAPAAGRPAAPANSAASASGGGTPPGLGAAATAVVAPSAGQPAVSAAGQPATPAQIPVQALAAPEASWQGLRDADAFQIVQEKHGVPNPPPVVTQLADAPSTLGVAWGAVKDAYTGFADYRKEQNARVDASAAATHFINTYLERPLIPAPSLSEYRRKPQEGEAKEYFAARGAMLEHRLLTPEQVAHLDQFFAPYAAEGFIPASRPPGEQRPSGALADVPLLEDAPDPPAPPSGNPPASAGLAGGALFTQRVADLSQRYGFANPKQAAIAASLPDGIDDTKREMAREFRKEYAKLTAVDESYDASSGVLVTKHGGVVTGIRTLGVAGNSAKAEKEKFELIKDLVKTYIPTIKDKKGRVLNPEEEAEFISQATTLTNQMPGVEITAANMPKLIFMFKLQKSLSMAEEGKVKFTSLAPAYNLVKAGGKYLDEEVAQTTLLKAAGMEAQSQASGGNLDAGQAVKIITAPDHPITGHLIKHNMDPALAVHITDRIEARIAEWRTRNPDDPTSTPVLARRILNEFIAKTKEDRAGSAGDKAARVRKEAYGNGEAK